MSQEPSLTGRRLVRRSLNPAGVISLIFGLAVISAVLWAMYQLMRDAPARDATADLGAYGLVTIRFSTDPNPPLPTGTVTLSFMPMDSRQRSVALDSLTFEYGLEGADQPVGVVQAEPMTDNQGMLMLMGGAQFPQVGSWWVRATARKGQAQDQVRFTFRVEPAQ